jgi:hypothetical protein
MPDAKDDTKEEKEERPTIHFLKVDRSLRPEGGHFDQEAGHTMMVSEMKDKK